MAAKLVVGCGYLGFRVATHWREQGNRVYAVTRSSTRATELEAAGLVPIVADVTRRESLRDLPPVESLFYAVGFDRASEDSISAVYAGGLRNVLQCIPPEMTTAIYASTTGVYGDAEGGWVDEETPPAPGRPGGIASLEAEQVLTAESSAIRSAILRFAGLYGPGRIPMLKKAEQTQAIPVNPQSWLNLIHVEDAALIVASVERLLGALQPDIENSLVINVSDGTPVRRGDYYGEIARLRGLTPPQFEEPLDSDPRAQRAAASKRISNRLLSEQVDYTLRYPSFREGLRAALSDALP